MKSASSLSQQHTVCLKRNRKRNGCSLVPQIDESAVDDRVLADAIARSRPASVDTRGPSTLNAKVYLGHHVVWKLLARNFATHRCHLSKFCISPFCFLGFIRATEACHASEAIAVCGSGCLREQEANPRGSWYYEEEKVFSSHGASHGWVREEIS